jgi:hypothetical protein
MEQRYTWGRAYRAGEIVCARVHVTIERDERLGLAARRNVLARFQERLDGALYAELTELVHRRGAAARRAAERMAPVVLVLDGGTEGRQRIVGRIQPPQSHRGELREIQFAVHEPHRS